MIGPTYAAQIDKQPTTEYSYRIRDHAKGAG